MITSLDQLSPAARDAAQSWLDASGRVIDDPDLRNDVVDELRSALLDGVDADATPADVAAVAERLGPVSAEREGDDDRLAGSIGGVPYDLRRPTAERIRRTWWDPRERRLFVPRAYGAGWALNFGALAVRLGLIEPDAEDEPFASTPPAALRAALALPVALAGATVLHYAVRGRSLPARLPNHWDAAGRPDGWTSKGVAAAADIAVTVVPTAFAALQQVRGRTPQAQAGGLAAAAMASSAGAVLTVWRAADNRPRWWAGPALVAAMTLAAGGTLVGLARAGRAAEQARDLGGLR